MPRPKNIPVVIDLLRGINMCNRFGFEIGHPIREALRALLRVEGPILRESIAKSKEEREAKNRKPQQMRLFA